MHQVAPLALRQAMGVGKRHFARILGCHRNTITRWEKGICDPSHFAALKLHLIRKQFDRSSNPRFPLPKSYVQPDKMAYYLGKPGPNAWIHWTWKRRMSFMACRAKYKRILADAQAGRCIIEYRTPKPKKVVDAAIPPVAVLAKRKPRVVESTNDKDGNRRGLAVL